MYMSLESMIRSELAKGKSLSEVGKTINETMAKLHKEAEDKTTAREKKRQQLEDEFHKHYKEQNLEIDDVAALAALVCESDYPNWSDKDIESFCKNVKRNVEILAEMQKKKDGEGSFETLWDVIEENLKRML